MVKPRFCPTPGKDPGWADNHNVIAATRVPRPQLFSGLLDRRVLALAPNPRWLDE
jgi:hypothetical protein